MILINEFGLNIHKREILLTIVLECILSNIEEKSR